MSKPITGKTHVGERREKRPNGDIYYSPDNEAKKELAFRKDLLELKALLKLEKTGEVACATFPRPDFRLV